MSLFANIVAVISGAGVIIGAVVAIVKVIKGFTEGQKCLLRTNMLDTYYRWKDEKQVPQYELQNFYHLYESYKRLGGNSFIDDVKKEVEEWTIKS